MLIKCHKVLLLSDVSSFTRLYKELAEEAEVCMEVEPAWNARYRINADVVIAGSKYLKDIHKNYYPETVVILKEGESPVPFIKEGISHFIFDYKNKIELTCAFYKEERKIISSASMELQDILKISRNTNFSFGDYDFDFSQNRFYYQGKAIYFSENSKKFLADWLLNGKKDNTKRMTLCNLRKKFGSGFLKEIDVHGNIKEEYYEQ